MSDKIKYVLIANVGTDVAYYEEFATSADVAEALDIADEAVEDQLKFNEAWENTRLYQRLHNGS
jgi:hypothetical protein